MIGDRSIVQPLNPTSYPWACIALTLSQSILRYPAYLTWAAFLVLVSMSYKWELASILLCGPCFLFGFIELTWQPERRPLTPKGNGFYWFDPLHEIPGTKWQCWIFLRSQTLKRGSSFEPRVMQIGLDVTGWLSRGNPIEMLSLKCVMWMHLCFKCGMTDGGQAREPYGVK